ncbi:death-on-curing protein [Cephaloticoccus primus]|uniref:Death-on-curing protein n=1 Tax=Cephaloticoccus primus TaxID=1548207 RepID=A0A139SJF3_9BACT|nr:type II toxin-antitoxin system death-on-curing family toxin [Cephaloticoccus primus]KXU34661.1 death-on-curing protein [Cephaloticoccus primus]
MTSPNQSWIWLEVQVVCAINDEQINGHGWLDGLRDASALDSAIARPKNLAAYEVPDACALAAAYAFGIARNHPFVDGNKRAAWLAAILFLETNGYEFSLNEAEAIAAMLALAAGEMSEDAFAQWLRERVRSL